MALYKNPIYGFCILLSLQLLTLPTKAASVAIESLTNPKLSQDIPEPVGPGTPDRSVPGGTFVRFEPPANVPGFFGPPSNIAPRPQPPSNSAPTPALPPLEHRCQPATLLLPFGNIGLTASEYPTFFVGVTRYAKNGTFILYDEAGQQIYETSIPLNENLGLFAINLPKTAPGLEIDKNYRWSFTLLHSETKQPTAEGWIRRIEIDSNLQAKLNQSTPLERAALYAQNGIWFDTLSTLAQMQGEEPKNTIFVNEWQALLKSQGLEQVAQMPLN
ncbi:DUF928 domain-containing protein [Ancylothrix sp. C2]|uniref:DUF928 domain-containing protein n=1 Tax=Ancylothrix sp. D3o TaxID=2953691 RepID=UPI0021BA4A1E|nr:DUF928 domain-containing protein [Ancylothrix sp. D3o]MCT7952489.1 DUF928 domain-containing protein [Ancylothrix sp. D3o]